MAHRRLQSYHEELHRGVNHLILPTLAVVVQIVGRGENSAR